MRYSQWHCLALWAQGKAREAYVREYGADCKCPVCHAWKADCEPGRVTERPDGLVSIECGRCGAISIWDFGAPAPIRMAP